MRMDHRRAGHGILLGASLALGGLATTLVTGCGEGTPGGSELVQPADRSAVPTDPDVREMTEPERREEDLEAAGLTEPEPGDEGFDTGEDDY